MKTKKLLALLLASTLSMSLLTGCGGGGGNADNSGNSDGGASNTNTADTAGGDANTADPSGTADTTGGDANADAGNTNASGDSDVAYVKDKGTLIVGITDFAPMDYHEEGNSDWIGFDADMAKAFAAELGVTPEFIEINWDNKIMELDTKAIDAVWNGMTLTDEVKSSMSCSAPYCLNAQVVVVPSDKADQYGDVESIKGLNFAVESGSAGQAVAEGLELNFTAVKTQADALMEVSSGASDACVIDLLMAGAMIGEGTSYPDLTYTVNLNDANGDEKEEYVVGFRKGSDLTDAFNDFYRTAYEDGTVETLATTYGVQESILAPQ